VATEWAIKYVGGWDSEPRDFAALARSGEKWLLYDPRTSNFSVAIGSELKQPLGLLGFASGDALAEWLG